MAVLATAGIRTVADVLSLAADSANISGFSPASIKKLQAAAVVAIPGGFHAERVIDHKKAANPYESLHGGTWRSEILATVALKGSVSIETMMSHIFTCSAAAFAGTIFADSFLFTTMLFRSSLRAQLRPGLKPSSSERGPTSTFGSNQKLA